MDVRSAAQQPSTPTIILLVTPERETAHRLRLNLAADGHAVWWVRNSEEAEQARRELRPDLIIIDASLQVGNALMLAAKLQTYGRVPTILFASSAREADEILRLDLHEIDAVVTIADQRAFTERVWAALRKSGIPSNVCRSISGGPIHLGNVEIDPAQRRVLVNGIELNLTQTEFRLLLAIAGHPNESIPRRDLAELAWEHGRLGQTHVVDAKLRSLSAKLGRAGANVTIVPIREPGYALIDQ